VVGAASASLNDKASLKRGGSDFVLKTPKRVNCVSNECPLAPSKIKQYSAVEDIIKGVNLFNVQVAPRTPQLRPLGEYDFYIEFPDGIEDLEL